MKDKRAKLRRRVEVEEERIRGLLSVSVGINLLLQLAFHFTGDWYLQLTISSLLHFIGSFNSKFYHWHFISKLYNWQFHFKVLQSKISYSVWSPFLLDKHIRTSG